MVEQLEKSRGRSPLSPSRGAGYDILVKCNNGDEIHIEIKGIQREDKFFAINGLEGIRNFLFDDKYYIYFCDIENSIILVTGSDFIFENMGWKDSKNIKKLIGAWTDIADAIKGISGITVDSRIRFVLPHPIRKLVRDLQNNPQFVNGSLRNTIDSVWKLENNQWKKLYHNHDTSNC